MTSVRDAGVFLVSAILEQGREVFTDELQRIISDNRKRNPESV